MASRTFPTSIKIFGILDLVFGTLGLLSSLNSLVNFSQVRQSYKMFPAFAKLSGWMPIQMLISALITIVLLILGIGLLKRQPWARSFSVYLGIFVISFGLLNLLVTAVMLGGGGDLLSITMIIGTLFGVLFGSIYYGLMIYFLTRPEVKAAMD
jgi:hypothetical protein